jgi:hypothetical protein
MKPGWGGHMAEGTCSLSLWRVVRGSKLMHLELVHGLFIFFIMYFGLQDMVYL